MSEMQKISEQSVEKSEEKMQKCTHQNHLEKKNDNIKVKFFGFYYCSSY